MIASILCLFHFQNLGHQIIIRMGPIRYPTSTSARCANFVSFLTNRTGLEGSLTTGIVGCCCCCWRRFFSPLQQWIVVELVRSIVSIGHAAHVHLGGTPTKSTDRFSFSVAVGAFLGVARRRIFDDAFLILFGFLQIPVHFQTQTSQSQGVVVGVAEIVLVVATAATRRE